MSTDAFEKELIAAEIASQLGIKVPQSHVAVIGDDFIDSVKGETIYERLNKSKGKNFCSENIQDLIVIGKHSKLKREQLSEALKIFVFDVLIDNSDRSVEVGKPNLFMKGKEMWVLDHEMAFSFTMPIIGRDNSRPWKIHANDMYTIQNHVLFPKLKGKSIDFSVLDNFLDNLNDTFWQELEEKIPVEWKSENFEKIRDRIEAIISKKEVFLGQFKTILS